MSSPIAAILTRAARPTLALMALAAGLGPSTLAFADSPHSTASVDITARKAGESQFVQTNDVRDVPGSGFAGVGSTQVRGDAFITLRTIPPSIQHTLDVAVGAAARPGFLSLSANSNVSAERHATGSSIAASAKATTVETATNHDLVTVLGGIAGDTALLHMNLTLFSSGSHFENPFARAGTVDAETGVEVFLTGSCVPGSPFGDPFWPSGVGDAAFR